jgi:hypothetical protein
MYWRLRGNLVDPEICPKTGFVIRLTAYLVNPKYRVLLV